MARVLRFLLVATLVPIALTPPSSAQAPSDVKYQKPPREILELVDVDLPPLTVVDPSSRFFVLFRRPAYKTLEELAEPELRLAGLRLNPRNHNRTRTSYALGVEVRELVTGRVVPVTGLPDPIRIEWHRFSPHGTFLSFARVEPDGLSLWVVRLATGQATRVTPPVLSAVLGPPCVWTPDETALLCRVRPGLAAPAEERALPAGPIVQETTGKKAPGRTYQDLLRSAADERTFEHYAAVEIRRFALDGTATTVLPAGIHRSFDVSPDGNYLLVETSHRPFSYQFPLDRFPYRAVVTDRNGATVAELADKPLQDDIPVAFDAAERGRRDFAWRGDAPATVTWAEAQDGGDPAIEAEFRDRLFQLGAPFAAAPQPLCATRNRFRSVTWGNARLAVVSDSRWKDRRARTYLVDPSTDNPAPRVLFDVSTEDIYHLPGEFVTTPDARGRDVLLLGGKGSLYLEGEGHAPEGSRPFLDELDPATGKTTRLWRADGVSTYETLVDVVDVERGTLLTRVESPNRFPNLYLRELRKRIAPRPLTEFPNPFKGLEGVSKQKIRYVREDGVELSADLFLPRGYDKARDGRLPMLMEAYPVEFKDKAAAGMVDDSPHRFVVPRWGSPVFWAVRGYAVLENAQFPIVGQGDAEPNDTYIEQLVMNARAAIRAVDEMGVVDPKRVAVMGHSYGAFMTANLLAHCDLFAAGIARSGAYNRTLTPFGFQAEERTFWQARDVYMAMSPFTHAEKINEPVLLIHGEADNNTGTFPMQSERLFAAIKGLGGRARYVVLPFESHGYAARENVLHMLWEMDTWLETWVRSAGK
jgi:dipeptidyl aminopeptidase/acylaminoacyl peptidase